jgi:3-oxoacyl-[acyl-carrier-protein] synthase-1
MASAARLINMGPVRRGGDRRRRFAVRVHGGRFLGAGIGQRGAMQSDERNRNGINIGEGAALFLMTREPAPPVARLCGWGESSDGHHMSAPDPAGGGARLAMTQALQRAGIDAAQIDYINMHGTATHSERCDGVARDR